MEAWRGSDSVWVRVACGLCRGRYQTGRGNAAATVGVVRLGVASAEWAWQAGDISVSLRRKPLTQHDLINLFTEKETVEMQHCAIIL